METLVIDLDGVLDRGALMRAFARDLPTPAGFGANWDALADVLRDLSWRPADGYRLELRGAGPLTVADPRSWQILREILDEARAFWSAQDVPFDVAIG
ncbi:barstar family protein [Patulibacter defluvii]|uniref:barstar family protein n=1 Tax=Patulibacter defluvii TaxID=3095358 RepID=UPI002A75F12D|nr:barstar family protein [Patulibacter sp. DM4]